MPFLPFQSVQMLNLFRRESPDCDGGQNRTGNMSSQSNETTNKMFCRFIDGHRMCFATIHVLLWCHRTSSSTIHTLTISRQWNSPDSQCLVAKSGEGKDGPPCDLTFIWLLMMLVVVSTTSALNDMEGFFHNGIFSSMGNKNEASEWMSVLCVHCLYKDCTWLNGRNQMIIPRRGSVGL